MSLRAVRWASLAMIAFVLALTFAMTQWRKEKAALISAQIPSPPAQVLGTAPDFVLHNRDGSLVGTSDLAGRPWVADFIFTRCALSCPRLTSVMKRLGADVPGLTRVSFSVDPDYDTPEVLAGYALGYAISDPDWFFLTGAESDLRAVVVDGFKLPIVNEPPPEQASPDEPILHSSRFVLVDAEGAIRGYYLVNEPGEYERLLQDLEVVEAENPIFGLTGREMNREVILAEIEQLHAFFEGWFLGTLPQDDQTFARFEGALSSGFSIIGPAGVEFDRAGVLEMVRGAHGSRSGEDFAIWIESVRVRRCGTESCLATYEEWQGPEGSGEGRLSSVVFELDDTAPTGLLWRHVHETWLPESPGDGDPSEEDQADGDRLD